MNFTIKGDHIRHSEYLPLLGVNLLLLDLLLDLPMPPFCTSFSTSRPGSESLEGASRASSTATAIKSKSILLSV